MSSRSFVSFGDVAGNSAKQRKNPSSGEDSKTFASSSSMSMVYDGESQEIRLASKKVFKKDHVTRKKGLQELQSILSTSRAIEDTLGFIPHFCFIYEQLWQESTGNVREHVQKVLDIIVRNVLASDSHQQALTPFMHLLIGPWWVARCDSHKEPSSIARASFKTAIPGPKRQQKVLFYLSPCILRYIQRILELTPEAVLYATATGGRVTKGTDTKAKALEMLPARGTEDWSRCERDAEDRFAWLASSALGGLVELLEVLDEGSLIKLFGGVPVPPALSSSDLHAGDTIGLNSLLTTNLLWQKMTQPVFTKSVLKLLMSILNIVKKGKLHIGDCGCDVQWLFSAIGKEIKKSIQLYSRSEHHRVHRQRCTDALDAYTELAGVSGDIYWKGEKNYHHMVQLLAEAPPTLAYEYALPLLAPLPLQDMESFLVQTVEVFLPSVDESAQVQTNKAMTCIEVLTFSLIKFCENIPETALLSYVKRLRDCIFRILEVGENTSQLSHEQKNSLARILAKLHTNSIKDRGVFTGREGLLRRELWDALLDRISDSCFQKNNGDLEHIQSVLGILSQAHKEIISEDGNGTADCSETTGFLRVSQELCRISSSFFPVGIARYDKHHTNALACLTTLMPLLAHTPHSQWDANATAEAIVVPFVIDYFNPETPGAIDNPALLEATLKLIAVIARNGDSKTRARLMDLLCGHCGGRFQSPRSFAEGNHIMKIHCLAFSFGLFDFDTWTEYSISNEALLYLDRTIKDSRNFLYFPSARDFCVLCILKAVEHLSSNSVAAPLLELGENILQVIDARSNTDDKGASDTVVVYMSCARTLLEANSRRQLSPFLQLNGAKRNVQLSKLIRLCHCFSKQGFEVPEEGFEEVGDEVDPMWLQRMACYVLRLAERPVESISTSFSEPFQLPEVVRVHQWVDIIKLQRLMDEKQFHRLLQLSLEGDDLRVDLQNRPPHKLFAKISRKFSSLLRLENENAQSVIAGKTKLFSSSLPDTSSKAYQQRLSEYCDVLVELFETDERWLQTLFSSAEDAFHVMTILNIFTENNDDVVQVQRASGLRTTLLTFLSANLSAKQYSTHELVQHCVNYLTVNGGANQPPPHPDVATNYSHLENVHDSEGVKAISSAQKEAVKSIFASVLHTPVEFSGVAADKDKQQKSENHMLEWDTPLPTDVLVHYKDGKSALLPVEQASSLNQVGESQKCYYVQKIPVTPSGRMFRLSLAEAAVRNVHKEVGEGEFPYYTLSINSDREIQTEAQQVLLCESDLRPEPEFYGSLDGSSVYPNGSDHSMGSDHIIDWLSHQASMVLHSTDFFLEIVVDTLLSLCLAVDSGSLEATETISQVVGQYRHQVAQAWESSHDSMARAASMKILRAVCQSNFGRGEGVWLPFILRAVVDSEVARITFAGDVRTTQGELEELGHIFSILFYGTGSVSGDCSDMSSQHANRVLVARPWRALLELTDKLYFAVALQEGSWLFANEHRTKTFPLQRACFACLRGYWAALARSQMPSTGAGRNDAGSAKQYAGEWQVSAVRLCIRRITKAESVSDFETKGMYFDALMALHFFVLGCSDDAGEAGSASAVLLAAMSSDAAQKLLNLLLRPNFVLHELLQIVAFKVLDAWYGAMGDRIAFSLDSHAYADDQTSAEDELRRSLMTEDEVARDIAKSELEKEARDLESDRVLFSTIVGAPLADAMNELENLFPETVKGNANERSGGCRILGLFWLLCLQKIDQVALQQDERGFIVRARCGAYLRQTSRLQQIAAALLQDVSVSKDFESTKKLSELNLRKMSRSFMPPYKNDNSGGNQSLWDAKILLSVSSSEVLTKTLAYAGMLGLYRMAVVLPTATRAWSVNELNRTEKANFGRFIEHAVRPDLVDRELDLIRNAKRRGLWDEDEFIVHGFKSNGGEVSACYVCDGAKVEIKIKIPAQYPLCNVEVESVSRLGVSESRMRHVRFQIIQLLSMQDGTIVDGVQLWKSSLEKEFEGQEPCPICYSTLDAKTLQLPSMSCPTCSNKFHPTCLNQWFKQSGKYKCVVCQQPFFQG